ncbi:flagellar protein [Paenibacillus antri]|uniref:Flagellar protein n=1 Tax=Paenibacillus antri TaxID=2582848 RepID=A0A5R9G2I2_9BACL|nr:flagellar protein [Paenibacillus antri]TLS50567.1 flagellar protein [Paenibacillus antri]
MTLNVTNCPKCGRLMQKGIRSVCPNCHQEIEAQYEKCLKYLRENRKCTLGELSEATGVTTGLITKFIREGRISIAEFENMSYQCEVCGGSIRDGNLCESCRSRLVKDVKGIQEDERRQAQQQVNQRTGFLKDKR